MGTRSSERKGIQPFRLSLEVERIVAWGQDLDIVPGCKPINGVFAELEPGAQAGMHPWLGSEGESVPCSKLGYVVGDGVQLAPVSRPGGTQMERQSMFGINAAIVGLYDKVWNAVGVGATKDLFSISWDDTTKGLDSPKDVHAVIQVKIDQKGVYGLKGIENS